MLRVWQKEAVEINNELTDPMKTDGTQLHIYQCVRLITQKALQNNLVRLHYKQLELINVKMLFNFADWFVLYTPLDLFLGPGIRRRDRARREGGG